MDEALRQHVRRRAKNRCEYCRLPESVAGFIPFQVEHIRARQHRGSDALDNLCLACRRCNSTKGPNQAAFDPVTDQLVTLFDPRRELWEDHFRLENAVIVGLTPQGRATVNLLQMNDARRLRMRRFLLRRGEW